MVSYERQICAVASQSFSFFNLAGSFFDWHRDITSICAVHNNRYPNLTFSVCAQPSSHAWYCRRRHTHANNRWKHGAHDDRIFIVHVQVLTQIFVQVGNEWNQLNCLFGNETQKAHTVSSSISVCEVPAETHAMVRGICNLCSILIRC